MVQSEYAVYRIIALPLYLPSAFVMHISLHDYSLLNVRQVADKGRAYEDVRSVLNQIFVYAQNNGIIIYNPVKAVALSGTNGSTDPLSPLPRYAASLKS